MVDSFDPKISLENAFTDYKNLVNTVLLCEEYVEDDIHRSNVEKIFAVTRETIWKLLFGSEPENAKNIEMAGKLLQEHKRDAGYFSPWDFNDWIVDVRNEVVKRNMIEFWRDVMVKEEIGPCWARDSDYFDDMYDQTAYKFYQYGGCNAPFPMPVQSDDEENDNDPDSVPPISPGVGGISPPKVSNPNFASTISMETPLQDYLLKIKNEDDENKLKTVFSEARDVIWQLLFKEPNISSENFQKAAGLLETYKRDACFYNPWDYNRWIPSIRDELLNRKYFDFWKSVIVDMKCGPCSYLDSDYFDDTDDITHIEFYSFGDDFLSEYTKNKEVSGHDVRDSKIKEASSEKKTND